MPETCGPSWNCQADCSPGVDARAREAQQGGIPEGGPLCVSVRWGQLGGRGVGEQVSAEPSLWAGGWGAVGRSQSSCR